MRWFKFMCAFVNLHCIILGNNNTEDGPIESGENELDGSGERIGAVVTQIVEHPYAATLLKNNSYVCSAVILNTYWLLTLSKCFDSGVVSSYVSHKGLNIFNLRVGSTFNNKGGSLNKIKMVVNNFNLKMSAVKLKSPLAFGPRVAPVRLPNRDDDVILGTLASMIAWTPPGHMRAVNAPVIESSICETYTNMPTGHYICVAGVQDPDRHFCRRDNGGAIIQNNTLIGITSFLHTCALYTRPHAFPKTSSFIHWLNSVVWDEENPPTTPVTTETNHEVAVTTKTITQSTTNTPRRFDANRLMLTLPYDAVNLPLEPAEDNSVIPRISLYESYLQSMARAKTPTTLDPKHMDVNRKEWLQKYGSAWMMVSSPSYLKKYENMYDYKD